MEWERGAKIDVWKKLSCANKKQSARHAKAGSVRSLRACSEQEGEWSDEIELPFERDAPAREQERSGGVGQDILGNCSMQHQKVQRQMPMQVGPPGIDERAHKLHLVGHPVLAKI